MCPPVPATVPAAALPSTGSPVPAADSPYWAFYAAVAAAQLAAWLPLSPARILDLSGTTRFTAQLVAAGHEVLHVHGPAAGHDRHRPARPGPVGPGRVVPVVADLRTLRWLGPDSVDLVLAESGALSRCLAAEDTLEHLSRVLRPGGRVFLVVDSLTLGLARLAGQGRWAELADTPSADLVLVPDEDGSITRCFAPDELRGLLRDAGLVVDWVRARSALTPTTVERAVALGGTATLRTLVRTELALTVERADAANGLHLVASAHLP